MKKLTILFVLLAVLFTTFAATPVKLVRLEVINQSGDTVFMKLTGIETGSYYYLTIPDKETKLYTLATDLYTRTTSACGFTNPGRLNMTSNTRLKFVECNRLPNKIVAAPRYPETCQLLDTGLYSCPNYGEPGNEKVVYFNTTIGGTYTNGICGGWVLFVTVRSPAKGLCFFRYRY